MVNFQTFQRLALSYPNATEQPHFDKTSFRVRKKIFATVSLKDNKAVLKLSENDQSVFCTLDKNIFSAVNNKWGRQGWTVVDLGKVSKEILVDALGCAYNELAKIKTGEQ